MASNDRNRKEVIVSIKGDNSELDSAINESKEKLQGLGDGEINSKSVKEFKQEVKSLSTQIGEAEDRAAALQQAGKFNTTEYKKAVKEVAKLRHEQEKLDSAVEAFNPANKLGAFVGVARGAATAVQGYAGAMQFLGMNSEDTMKSIAKLQGLMAFTDALSGIDNIKNSFRGLGLMIKGLIPSLKGANIASKALGFSLKALGIGLITAAIAYLIEHFKEVKGLVTDFVPELGNLSDMFGKVKEIAMGVGGALIKFLASPIEAIVKLIHGDFSGAWDSVKEGFKFTKNFKKGVQAYDKKQEEKHLKELQEQRDKAAEERKKKEEEHQRKLEAERQKYRQAQLQKEKEYQQQRASIQGQINSFIEAETKRHIQATMTAREKDLDNAKSNYEDLLANAKQYGIDAAKLTETYRKQVADINDKYDKQAEQNAKAKAAKKKIGTLSSVSQKAQANVITAGLSNGITADDTPDTAKQKIFNIAQAKIEAEDAAFELEKEQKLQQGESIELIAAQHEQKLTDIRNDAAQKRMAIDNAVAENKKATLAGVGNALGALSDLIGEKTAAGKALAIAQATINTYLAATEVLRNPTTIPEPFGSIQKIASMITIVATGLKQVKEIASVKVPHSSGSSFPQGASVPRMATATAPVIATNQPTVQDVRVTNQKEQKPIEAYVTDRELQNSNKRRNVHESLSTL